jgi:hypothetical protein
MDARRSFWVRAWLALLVGFATFGAGACEVVSSFPARLSKGAYCLDGDLGIGDATAFLLGDDTSLDCHGHRVRDLSSTAFAVIAQGSNITLRNCVFEGFSVPVFFDGVTNYAIEGNTLRNARDIAVSTDGSHGYVKGNVVINTVVRDGSFNAIRTYGIADVIGNIVMDSKDSVLGETDNRMGILSYDNDGGLIAFNIVQNTGRGSASGWAMLAGGESIAYRNVLVAVPGLGDTGLKCYQWSGLRLQNLFVGQQYHYMQCPIIDYNG